MSALPTSAADRPIAVLVDREGLGDALLKLPMLRAIRRGFPQRRVWWIATHETSMARELAPFVSPLLDRVIENAKITSPASEAIKGLRRLPPFDLVFDTRTRVATVLLARLVLAHRGFFACLPGYLFSDRRPPGRRSRPRGIAERAITMVEAALGGRADWEGTFDVSAAARQLMGTRMPEGPRYVGFAIGSREARKNWPQDRFAALAGRVAEMGCVPVFFTGPQEKDRVADLKRAVRSALFPQAEPVDPALGLAPLEPAIAIGTRLSAAVANDSGMGHLLGALGTPLVSLFGPTDARKWAPLTRRGVIVRAQDFGADSMDAIPVDAVLRALKELLLT